MAKILIADDDPSIREMLHRALAMRGARISEVANGAQAIQQVRETGPEVVLIDMILPEVDGLEAISAIRQVRPNTLIIAISGGGRVRNLDVLETAKQLGADAVLPKPFNLQDLIGCLEDRLCVQIDESGSGGRSLRPAA